MHYIRTKDEVQSEQSGSAFFLGAHMHYIHCGQTHCARVWRQTRGGSALRSEPQMRDTTCAHAKRCMSTDRKTTAESY